MKTLRRQSSSRSVRCCTAILKVLQLRSHLFKQHGAVMIIVTWKYTLHSLPSCGRWPAQSEQQQHDWLLNFVQRVKGAMLSYAVLELMHLLSEQLLICSVMLQRVIEYQAFLRRRET